MSDARSGPGTGTRRGGRLESVAGLARAKPASDGPLEAARRPGLDPASCLVIEDALSGVTAARAAGSQGFGINTSFPVEQFAAVSADWMVTTPAEAPGHVLP